MYYQLKHLQICMSSCVSTIKLILIFIVAFCVVAFHVFIDRTFGNDRCSVTHMTQNAIMKIRLECFLN